MSRDVLFSLILLLSRRLLPSVATIADAGAAATTATTAVPLLLSEQPR